MFSGGIGSWAAARRVATLYGTGRLTLLFADTLAELKDRTGGGLPRPLPLRVLRERIAAGGQMDLFVDLFEIGGCGCFVAAAGAGA